MKSYFTLRAGDVQLYRVCDDLSGALILAMGLFSPWAFGTTQPWAIWVMNYSGYLLGALWLTKCFIRNAKSFRAPLWENYSPRSGLLTRHRPRETRWLFRLLGFLTLGVLLFILTSALNAGATYDISTQMFRYQNHFKWLPYSLDATRTWFHFWMYLGLAGAFWAMVDWLSGMTLKEERECLVHHKTDRERGIPLLPHRLKVLVWVLALNGLLVGVEGIVQRTMGCSKLLFLVQPTVNPEAVSQFGPYAYRANAAQYFNLLWPVCLGFWWTLQRLGGTRFRLHHLLLVAAAVMAACPVVSSSRGGAIIAASLLVLAVAYLLISNFFNGGSGRKNFRSTPVWLIIFLAASLWLGWHYGWGALAPRLEQLGEGFDGRNEMYEAARPMTRDYLFFGTGPGTFATVFSLYRFSDDVYWPEQLHNDWLETQITFGWFGLGLLLLALGCLAVRWWFPGGVRGSRRFVVLLWLAQAGCLVHALFDFPFQIHSILLLFLINAAILFCLSRSGASSPG